MDNLYRRLGGYDAIAAVVDDVMPRFVGDPQIGVYWRGLGADTRRRQRQLIVDFLAEACGGPVNYNGRDMAASHNGLNITEGDWDIFVGHIAAALNKFSVPAIERDELLAAVAALKPGIVGK